MAIEFKDNEFILNGTPSSIVAKTLQESGLSDSVIAEIVGGWFVGVTGATQPVPFHFSTPVEKTDPECTVDYDRNFAHIDWIDGESRVQAGMTPEELGFNARFHAIENEFEAISGQFGRLGRCVAGIRSDLFGVVAELEAKLTALQNDIHARKKEERTEPGPKFLGTVKREDRDILIAQQADQFKFVGFQEAPIRMLNPRGAIRPIDPRPTPSRLIELTKGLAEVLDMPEVEELWQAGVPVTVGSLRTSPATATVVLPSGEPLGALLAALPAGMEFGTPTDAVAEIVERFVGDLPQDSKSAIRDHVLTGAAAGREGSALLSSEVSGLGFDERLGHALTAANLGTVAKLSAAKPHKVAATLRVAGLDPDQAGGVLARAVLAKAVRNVRVG